MIVQSVCASFMFEMAQGVHQPGDDYRLALYQDIADLSAATTVYTTTDEVVGDGYVAGGKSLTGRSVIAVGRAVIIDFDDVVWAVASITASGALIYNATRANAAVGVLSFGGQYSSTNGPFTVQLPPATETEALIRIRR